MTNHDSLHLSPWHLIMIKTKCLEKVSIHNYLYNMLKHGLYDESLHILTSNTSSPMTTTWKYWSLIPVSYDETLKYWPQILTHVMKDWKYWPRIQISYEESLEILTPNNGLLWRKFRNINPKHQPPMVKTCKYLPIVSVSYDKNLAILACQAESFKILSPNTGILLGNIGPKYQPALMKAWQYCPNAGLLWYKHGHFGLQIKAICPL